MVDVYMALGPNLGDRAGHLRRAVARLAEHPGLRLAAVSPVYETAAHTLAPDEIQPAYLNAVAHVRTAMPPAALLRFCQQVEAAAGRDRTAAPRWAPRTLDLDLLLYDGVCQAGPGLILPHPRMAERRFVLQPLHDLAPRLYVPAPHAATVAALLARCPDTDVPVRTGDVLRPQSDRQA